MIFLLTWVNTQVAATWKFYSHNVKCSPVWITQSRTPAFSISPLRLPHVFANLPIRSLACITVNPRALLRLRRLNHVAFSEVHQRHCVVFVMLLRQLAGWCTMSGPTVCFLNQSSTVRSPHPVHSCVRTDAETSRFTRVKNY